MKDIKTKIEKLHQNIHFQDPINKKIKYWYRNGVVQGSPISPQLFNIYLDGFIQELKEENHNLDFQIMGYADDLDFGEYFLKLVTSNQQEEINSTPDKKIIPNYQNIRFLDIQNSDSMSTWEQQLMTKDK